MFACAKAHRPPGSRSRGALGDKHRARGHEDESESTAKPRQANAPQRAIDRDRGEDDAGVLQLPTDARSFMHDRASATGRSVCIARDNLDTVQVGIAQPNLPRGFHCLVPHLHSTSSALAAVQHARRQLTCPLFVPCSDIGGYGPRSDLFLSAPGREFEMPTAAEGNTTSP